MALPLSQQNIDDKTFTKPMVDDCRLFFFDGIRKKAEVQSSILTNKRVNLTKTNLQSLQKSIDIILPQLDYNYNKNLLY